MELTCRYLSTVRRLSRSYSQVEVLPSIGRFPKHCIRYRPGLSFYKPITSHSLSIPNYCLLLVLEVRFASSENLHVYSRWDVLYGDMKCRHANSDSEMSCKNQCVKRIDSIGTNMWMRPVEPHEQHEPIS